MFALIEIFRDKPKHLNLEPTHVVKEDYYVFDTWGETVL